LVIAAGERAAGDFLAWRAGAADRRVAQIWHNGEQKSGELQRTGVYLGDCYFKG